MTTARLPTTVGALDTVTGLRSSALRSGLRVSTSDATETTAKTSSWMPGPCAEPGRDRGGDGTDGEVERDERERQHLGEHERKSDHEPHGDGDAALHLGSFGLSTADASRPDWKPPPSAATAPMAAIASDGTIISVIPWPSATCGSAWMYWYVSRSGVGSPSWMAPNACRVASASPCASRIFASRDPSARRIAACFSPSAVRICDCLMPSAGHRQPEQPTHE